MSNKLNIENVKRISNRIVRTLEEKNKLYGDSLFCQKEFGLYVRMFDKFRRITNIINSYSEKYPSYTKEEIEAIVNSLIDIVGYSLAWLSLYFDSILLEKELESKL